MGKKATDVDDLLDAADSAPNDDDAAVDTAPVKAKKAKAKPAAGKEKPAAKAKAAAAPAKKAKPAAKEKAAAAPAKAKGKAKTAEKRVRSDAPAADSPLRKALLKVRKATTYATVAEAGDFNIRSVRRAARAMRDAGEIELTRDGQTVYIRAAV